MNYKKTTLKNGLRIITAPVAGTETATVVVMVGVGSRHETEKEAGISHFLEHMMFKGTKKRPTTLDISSELDAIGGEFNAFNSKDKNGYYAKVDAKHLDTALDVVADMYLNSKIEEEEIKKESGTILQELNMYEDTPMRRVDEIFETLLYGKNPLGRDIVGYKKTIKALRRKNFIDYMKKFYVASDTVVSIAGKFDEDKTIAQVEKYFSGMKKGKKAEPIRVSENQKSPGIKVKFKKTDQTHLILGVRAYDWNSKDRYSLSLLSVILGGNMSSRLFIEVREKRGLAYYIRTSRDSFVDVGYLSARAGVEHKNLGLVIETILAEYR
jgi:predicted Zn-dependent peptidase